jgi:hypothetical protein
MLPAPVTCLAVVSGNQKTSVPGLGAQFCRMFFRHFSGSSRPSGFSLARKESDLT